MRLRSVLVVVLIGLVVSACGGGGGDSPATSASGSPGTTGSPSGTTGNTSPTPTDPPTSGSDTGSVTVEIGDTTHELSVSKTITIPGVADVFFPTRCEPNFFSTGVFWVIALAVDDRESRLEPGYQMDFRLNANGEFDDYGFKFDDDVNGVDYELIKDDPGSWTVSGNRIQGEVNIGYWVGGSLEPKTTAQIDVTCPSD